MPGMHLRHPGFTYNAWVSFTKNKERVKKNQINRRFKRVDSRFTSDSGIKNENISNKELVEELHQTIIRNFNKRKVHSSFMDNIWGADLVDMQLISTSCYWHL